MTIVRCAILPDPQRPELAAAIRAGGGEVAAPSEADALIWTDPRDPEGLQAALTEHPGLTWIQLPFAGIEPFVHLLDEHRMWTCGKGVYAEPVAEHALALSLAGLRHVAGYARQQRWSEPVGRNLLDARVTVLGGGAITEALAALLAPFRARIRVVRNRPAAIDGVAEVVGPDQLHEALSDADVVVLALALTPETTGIIDAQALAAMPEHAWLINVARGAHVDTDALVTALKDHRIGGAGLDVTDPEPLPEGHPLWTLDNAIITPHIANTPEMGAALLAERVEENVRRRVTGQELLGPVHLDLGY